ncbi:arsenate reductase family protein [Halarcobacter ebronensis]|uniref:Arsenate reductase family protein n=1 Tax=Halarcobacter ebronensis TaxID=1462615 RepID=A0A4Q1AKB2_9BACT|nr:Spx/MgsR family RNA polymerase-binding regulatory protein [Halarcobacter ebronensis]QKF83244.1 arsenate reductase (ArsC) family protein [Halarcobacter ebronensis]RXJ65882.1 arsenate reductase family protein [Halarcobacter ebronensis]RXK05121.1 arsenate reductase family protein [Halarcobacter ebronensis]
MRVYGIKSCPSVKKAKAFFDENNICYEFIDLTKEPVDLPKIENWQRFIPATQMLNPRSKTYKDLGLKDKKTTEKKAVSIISKDNGILKRPIIEHGLNGEEKFTIGFDEEEYKTTFLS